MRFAYPIELEELPADEGGGLLVRFPDWGSAVTDGADLTEALENARDCLEEMIADRINRREVIPPPSPARDRRLIQPESALAMKAALWCAMQACGMTPAELAQRLGHASATQIERLLNPRLKARPELLDAAAAALGKRVVVELEDAA